MVGATSSEGFYPRDDMLARVLAMALSVCLSVCLSQVVGRIEVVFGTDVSFDQSYIVFSINSGIY